VSLLVFLGGSSLLEGVGIVCACPKVLNDFKTDVFEVNLLNVITSVPFSMHQVLGFAGTRSSTKFEYSFDFPSSIGYFTRMFLVTTLQVSRIVFDVAFDLADVDGVMDKRKSTVR